jgi:cytoskeletal protein RodZ
MSNYPRDEFDRVLENSARHGVHRASLEAPPRSLMPLMTFGVAALCIGLLAFLIVPKLSGNHATTAPPAAVSSTSAKATTPRPLPTSTAAQTTAAPDSPSPTPTPTPDSVLNKATPVAIYNATGIGGLAAKYSGIVMSDGWTVSQAANWAGQPQGASSIVYNGVAQKANAEELGKLLNIPTLLDSAEIGTPLAVILGPGAH